MKNTALRWLWNVPGKNKLNILALTVLQALHGASGVLYALLLREIVDAAVGGDHAGFRHFLLLLIGLVIVQLALRAAIRWLTELSKALLENAFKGRLLETLLHRDLLQVNAVHSGEWINRLTNDAKVAADGYVDIVPGLTGMIVKLISALVMILVLEPKFALILIAGGIVLILFTGLFRRHLKVLHKRIQEADGRLRVFLQERIGNLLMIRSFGAEDRTMQDAEQKMMDHRSARMRRIRYSNLANVGFGAAMSGMYLFGIGWCGYGILTGRIDFGMLTAITQLITQIQAPFANITGYIPRYYAMIASAERLMDAEQFEKDALELKSPEELQHFYRDELAAIGFDRVSFSYLPAGRDAAEQNGHEIPVVFNQLSLEIRKGQIIAVTGHSGCGKSTALKLLMCVYRQDSGQRYYIDKDGACYDLTADFRRLFAYVPQGNALMNGTIREVVSFAKPSDAFAEDRLNAALRIACADAFVSELPDGLDTMLGERGAGLSEGQMQRLSIARAVFSESPILLLDEATSALDAETERKLLENIRSMTDKTVVIVTHRTAALAICDRILEFTENGVISHDT